MTIMTLKKTKFFLFLIFCIFMLVSITPTYQLSRKIMPLMDHKQKFLNKAQALSLSRIYNSRLALLENIMIVNQDMGLSEEWSELAENLKSVEVPELDPYLGKRLNVFRDYHKVVRDIGREDTGLVGKMRDAAHRLEANLEDDASLVLLLQMRRREKDFLLRKKQIYAKMFFNNHSKLNERLVSQVSHTHLSEYGRLFSKVVDLTEKQFQLRAEYEFLARDYNDRLESLTFEHSKKDVSVLAATYDSVEDIRLVNVLSMLTLTGLLASLYVFLTRENKHKLQALREKIRLQEGIISNEKLAGLGTLTAGIAHEVKNPLSIIINASELIEEELKNKIDIHDLAQVRTLNDHVLRSANRAGAIVSNMLTLARGGEREKAPCSFKEIILDNYNLAYHSARAKSSIEVEFVPDLEELGKFNCSQADFSQAFINIFDNAFYALHEKKKTNKDFSPKINCSLKKGEGGIEIRVLDNGCGIPADKLNKIMEPFYTTKPPGEGTGLGMSFVFDVVKDHHGEIKIDSVEGEYTEIAILLKYPTEK